MTSHFGLLLIGAAPATYVRSRLMELAPSAFSRAYTWTGDGISMAWDTDQPAEQHLQPYSSRRGVVAVVDGRLDDRPSLCAALGLEANSFDSAIIAAAYEKWQADAFDRLTGDWSLALWDSDKRHLYLSRDYAGTRPLYYAITPTGVLWSSELDVFLRCSPEYASPDSEYAAEFITGTPAAERTPFNGVRKAPRGAYVCCRADGTFKSSRRWLPDFRFTIKYRDETQYDEHFLSLFRSAVRDRLRRSHEVWAELSGGLDSSSIVCMAAEITRKEPWTSVKAVSYTFDQGHPDDEQPYMEAVRNRSTISGPRLHESMYSGFFPDASQAPVLVPCSNPGRYSRVGAMMRESGAGLLLTGLGGDAVMWSSPRLCPHLADLLRSFSLRRFGSELATSSVISGRTVWDLLWNEAFAPLLPVRHRTRPHPHVPWLCRDRTGLQNPGYPECVDGSVPHSRQIAWRIVAESAEISALGQIRAAGGVNPSYPFLDRRLVEFMLAVPFDQKRRLRQTRVLHRRALRHLLPPEVISRTSKVSGRGFVCRAIAREWQGLVSLFSDHPRTADLGIADPTKVRDALMRARYGSEVNVRELLRTIAVEVWLRQVERAKALAARAVGVGAEAEDSR